MPKKYKDDNKELAKTVQDQDTTDLVIKYAEEFSKWRDELKPYWENIEKNQEMYEFYKREASETSSDVSLNTPFSIVESMVAKGNESTLNVTVSAKGTNGMNELEEYVAEMVKDAIEDADVAACHEPFRKIKEKFFRDFLVKGNAVAEVNWLYKTVITNGEKKVIADNPYTKIIHYKNYIFNPTYTFATSPVKYIEKYVDFDTLKNQEFKENEDGTKTGKYINLNLLKQQMEEDGLQDAKEQMFYSGGRKINKKVSQIHILERWEGPKLCVIANSKIKIRDEYDPLKIGRDNIVTAMNYTVDERPYAYGEIDPIYKPVRAQDTIVNQSIEAVNKMLRPGVLADPAIDLDNLIVLMEQGGAMHGNPDQIGVVPTNVPPAQAFQSIDVLQQAIERAARYSPYASGMGSQATDKTQGTLGGIARLQAAAEPNFQTKLDTLQDSFMRPISRIYLQAIGNLMGPDEVRYAVLKGKKTEWVMATKGILTGKATVQDLLTIGMITPEQVSELLAEMNIEMKETDVPEDKVVFDIDWLIDVKLDNQSATDKMEEARTEMAWVEFARNMGVAFSPERTATRFGRKMGVDDPEDLYLSEEEQQELMMQQQQEQRAQMQQQQVTQRQEQQQQQMMEQQRIEADLAKEQMRSQTQLQRDQMRQF